MNSNRITLLLFIGALITGLGGYYLTNNYINNAVAQHKASLDQGQEMVKIVVAASNLKAGDTIQKGNAQLRDMPRQYVHKNAVTLETFATTLNGRQLLYSLAKGDPILQSHVSLTQFSKFSDLIPEGMRVITIPIDNLSSISGFLAPGDIVDLLITLKDGPQTRTLPLLIGVKVVATGRNIDNGLKPKEGFNNISLGVSPKDAARIIHAQTVGKVSLTLRNETDNQDAYKHPINIDNLVDSKQQQPTAPPRPKGFEVIRGGRS